MATPAQFIAALRNHAGIKYTWGGKTPETGFDCSGLITYALAEVGVSFPHGSAHQIAVCKPIPVAEALTTPGALLYRPGHDAISLGDGTTIEAVTTQDRGVSSWPHGNRFTRAGLIPGIDYTYKEEPMGQMTSPFEGRVTANWRGYPGHKGMDIAPPKPGQTGLPIRAAFAGTVIKAITHAKPGNRTSTWAPGRTSNGVVIRNPDGEAQGYGHMRPVVSVGQVVKVGDIIGYNDRSGNMSGPHLHFECWASWKNSNSDYDPRLCFRKFKVEAGGAPSASVPSKPSVSKPSPGVSGSEVAKRLRGMGYTRSDATTIRKYQSWHGLKTTGVWDSATEAMYQKVVRAQNAVKVMKGVPDNWKSDGYWGATSKKWAAYTSGRNGWNNPKGYLTKKLINNLTAVGAY